MGIGSRALRRAIEQLEDPRRKQSSEFLHHVDVLDFLETLEIENISKSTADEFNFACPFPGHTSGDARPSAYMNDGSRDKSKTTVWKCHGCGRQGNGISFYAEMDNVSKQEATLHIKQTWAPNFRAPKGGSISIELADRFAAAREARQPLPEPKIIEWNHYDKLFYVDWEHAHELYEEDPQWSETVAYLFERGFSTDALSNWRIGYDPISERLTIPVTDVDGDLIGVKGRLPHDKRKPKYLILGDRENRRPQYKFFPYEKSLHVFGLDRVKTIGTLVLVEGELDVIALWMLGIPAVSTGSAHLSDEQAKLIRSYVDELVIFFDTNAAGENATWGYADKDGDWHPGVVEKLEGFMRLRVVEDHEHDASKLVQLDQADEVRRLVSRARSHLSYYLA